MKKVDVIIVDDERAARSELRRMLEEYPEFNITAEAKNADEAKQQIELRKPDVIFLDIQMPGPSGFDLLESLAEVPQVIFTTAFDEYAVKAFEVSALDYLVKPFRAERFALSMEKIRKRLSERSSIRDDQRRIFIKDGYHCYFVALNVVYLIESRENYACLYFNGKKALVKTSLTQLEEKLDENIFFRINRTQIINTNFIKDIEAASNSRIIIRLRSGEKLEVSERQSVKFRSRNRL
jgi:two-component system, LytTR family, response regulator